MALTPRQRSHLRALAQSLKPVVHVGRDGLTDAVLEELDRALLAHELVKVRILSGDREDRRLALARACAHLEAEPVQSIGRMLVLYRPAPEPRLHLDG